ncbi:MAG: exodeoxyribonuclease VII large subunit [Proteobacteria bacterium]|nr:exodeoxyribonuclease VII large subunit [Pseudomonadota bacterium]
MGLAAVPWPTPGIPSEHPSGCRITLAFPRACTLKQSSTSMMPSQDRKALTVSELNALLRASVEQLFPEVCVEGEISEVKAGKTGHVYFTIKDKEAQIAGVMWAGVARTLGFKMEQGLSVVCYAKPTVYQARGSLQLVAHRMIPGGEGALRKKFLELKAKLEKEGYFAASRKRPLPFLPKAIGIVTSAQGAVIHDIMVKLRERMPQVRVILADVKVQGDGAAESIAKGVKDLSDSGLVDVIIVARGGGSLEDLWAFNEEPVVKAIFASAVPVISGVGHEVDVSLSDFAADVRAPTPTAAAEMVVPHRTELLKTLNDYQRRLSDPQRWLLPLGQRLDELSGRLDRRVEAVVNEAELKLCRAVESLRAIQPTRLIEVVRLRIDRAHEQLNAALRAQLTSLQHRLGRLSDRYHSVHPSQVLSRGFSVVECGGVLVRSAAEVKVGDILSVTLRQGSLKAQVQEKQTK